MPFLIHWLALSTQLYSNQWHNKNHWNLLGDFQQLPEDEIEEFLPQICNILVERDQGLGANDEYGVYAHFHKLLVEKCAGCLPFGLRVCSLLKSAAQGPPSTGGFFQSILGSSRPATGSAVPGRDDRLRYLHQQAEEATSHGMGLTQAAGYLRGKYYHDLSFMLDTMARLGRDLKVHPVDQRNFHLRNAVAQLNSLLFTRMMAASASASAVGAQGSVGGPAIPYGAAAGMAYPSYGVTPQQVAQACPGAASYSLHLPLQHCRERVQRILRFVETECEVLPSKERCPYVLVAEVLEESFTCKSDELFTHQRAPSAGGPSPNVADIVAGVGVGARAEAGAGAVEMTGGPSPAASDWKGSEAVGINFANPAASQSQAQSQPQPDSEPWPHTTSQTQAQTQTVQGNPSFSSLQVRGGQAPPPLPPHLGQPQQYPPYQQHQQQQYPPYQQQEQQQQQYPPYQQQQQQQYPSPPFPQAYASPQQQPAPQAAFATIKSAEEKMQSIRASSPFGHLPGWAVKSFIVKSGDDLRKELLAMQIIDICQHVFQVEGLDLRLQPYQIISTGHMAGLVEFLEGTMSLDRMKKSAANQAPGAASLRNYFDFAFGQNFTPAHQKAVQCFVKSLAAYSLVTFLLQVRDRHNANLLIDSEGHIVHIDYGFILGGECWVLLQL